MGWTLIHEVYFYLVFTLLLWAPERQLSKILAGWALLILGTHGVLAVTGAAVSSPVLKMAIHPLTLEFIMGALVARAIHNRAFQGGTWVFFCGAALLVGGGAVFYAFRPDAFWGDWARVVCLGLPSPVLLAGAVTMEKKTGGALPGVLGVVGDASYSMYLSHFLLIQAIARACRPMIGRAGCTDLVIAVVMFAAVVIYGIASYRILERPVLMLLRRK